MLGGDPGKKVTFALSRWRKIITNYFKIEEITKNKTNYEMF